MCVDDLVDTAVCVVVVVADDELDTELDGDADEEREDDGDDVDVEDVVEAAVLDDDAVLVDAALCECVANGERV